MKIGARIKSSAFYFDHSKEHELKAEAEYRAMARKTLGRHPFDGKEGASSIRCLVAGAVHNQRGAATFQLAAFTMTFPSKERHTRESPCLASGWETQEPGPGVQFIAPLSSSLYLDRISTNLI